MTLEEYERAGKQVYEEFARVVATLFSDEIAKRGEIKLQHVQHRPKGLKSLRDKLVKEKVAADDSQIEEKIKDLAGCRLVFYTNTDVGRFRQSGRFAGFSAFPHDFTGCRWHWIGMPTGLAHGIRYASLEWVGVAPWSFPEVDIAAAHPALRMPASREARNKKAARRRAGRGVIVRPRAPDPAAIREIRDLLILG